MQINDSWSALRRILLRSSTEGTRVGFGVWMERKKYAVAHPVTYCLHQFIASVYVHAFLGLGEDTVGNCQLHAFSS